MRRVVTRKENPGPGEPACSATRLVYARNERVVTYATGETWDYDGDPATTPPINYTVTYGRAFRYDGARRRYLNRELALAFIPGPPVPYWQKDVVSQAWSDYDGDEIYGDFDLDPATESPIELRSFEPGIGTFGWMAGSPDRVPDPDSVQYHHTDMIGTLRNMTDSSGSPGTLRVLTAFGESIAGPGIHGAAGRPDRFGYAGEWGYQTDTVANAALRFPFLHVGARYYDPATGRFLQRDPIGISSGLNVYTYVGSAPTVRIDPNGLGPKPPSPAQIMDCQEACDRAISCSNGNNNDLKRICYTACSITGFPRFPPPRKPPPSPPAKRPGGDRLSNLLGLLVALMVALIGSHSVRRGPMMEGR